MSLYKQLWLAVIFLLTLVFGVSFVVTSLSTKAYLQEQLGMKNADNATALALSLTQQGADEVMLELTLAAQFDTGFYEMIQLADTEGKISIYRVDDSPIEDAPLWFASLLPIEVEPGIAAVQKGWQQLGVVTLRSHSKFAYAELWQSTQKMALVFLFAMILAGSLGTYLLKIILRPLDDVVKQAEAIGARRFITTPEPYTKEFKQVVAAMNKLSARIKLVLQTEAKRLEKWQRTAHIDKVTALLNREPFMQALDAALKSDDVNATGSLSLVRLRGLAQLNQLYGRQTIDGMLKDIGTALNRIVMQHSRWAASRLNGSDFAILAPRALDPAAAIREAQDAVREILQKHSIHEASSLPGAATIYVHGDTIGGLMTRLDGALLSADQQGESSIGIAHRGDIQMKPVRQQMDEWRAVFEQSFREHKFSLTNYPVIDLNGGLIHQESPIRLEREGEILSAGVFLPWINRLEMSLELDKQVVDLALQQIADKGKPVCINLSVAAVVEPSFLAWLSERLSSHPDAARSMWLEIPESMAFRHLEAFKQLASRAKKYQCKIGIEHVGHQLAELGQLHDVGVDYLKVDASFVRDIDNNTANQTLLRTLCTVGHSIGLMVIAEGVSSDEEWATLQELGADGATGPGIELPEA